MNGEVYRAMQARPPILPDFNLVAEAGRNQTAAQLNRDVDVPLAMKYARLGKEDMRVYW